MTRLRFVLAALLALGLVACGAAGNTASDDDDGGTGAASTGTGTGTSTGGLACGDGVKGVDELCDGADVGATTCEAVGLGAGTLACKPGCDALEVGGCGAPSTCGNGAVDGAEPCDGAALAGATCESLGFGPGMLGCLPNCGDFDLSACGPAEHCGNGALDDGESCDGAALNGASCESVGLGPGELGCLPNCSGLVTSGCTKLPSCGDGVIDQGELCDGDALGGASCVEQGFGAGELSCAADCQAYETAGCLTCDLPPLDQDATIDIDLKTLTVSGEVTENGASLAANGKGNYNRGSLRFVDQTTGDDVSVSLGVSGTATYGFELFASTYDVYVSTGSATYQDVLPGSAEHRVMQGVKLDANTVLDIDLKTLVVNGEVTENGASLANNGKGNYNRGSLRFIDRTTGDDVSASLGVSGPATYSFELFASVYDVVVSTGSATYQDVLPGSAEHLQETNVTLAASGTHDIDLHTLVVSGTVTENGATLASNGKGNYNRGSLRFVDTTTGDDVSASLGVSGPATYSFELFASTYDVYVSTGSATYQDVLPGSAEHVQETSLVLAASGPHDIDLRTLVVSGEVTENGATLANNGKGNYNRGSLRFVDTTTGDDVSASLGVSGAATYSFELFASTYDIVVSTGSATYQDVLPGSAEHRQETGLVLAASGPHDIDLHTIVVGGEVTENGASLANNGKGNYNRGSLRFIDRTTGDDVSASLGVSGPATYSFELFASSYDVVVSTGSATYQDVLPGSAEHRVETAVSLDDTGPFDVDLRTLVLSGEVTENGAALANNGKGNYNRGSLRFVDTTTGDDVSASLGVQGPATFSFELFASTYNVYVSTGSATYQDVLPGSAEHRVALGCAMQ